MVAEKQGKGPADGKGGGGKSQTSGRRGNARPAEGHVASALKTAYQETVKEDVPSEFLDLLGKLA